ncbi:MAG: hypothetical protein ACXVNN_09215 [Bacteroidia bacterium]
MHTDPGLFPFRILLMPLPSKTFSILAATAPGRIAFLPVVLICIGLKIVADKK